MPQDLRDDQRDKLKDLLERLVQRGTRRHFTLLLEKYHDADIAESLSDLDDELIHRFFRLYTRVSFENMLNVFEHLSTKLQADLMQEFSKTFSLKLLKNMDSDDEAALISELMDRDRELSQYLIEQLPKQDATVLMSMLAQEDTAGAMMNTDFLSVPETYTVRESLAYFRKEKPDDTEVSFFIFIVNDDNQLVGSTTLRSLLIHKGTEKVQDLSDDYAAKADVNMDKEEVARLFEKYDLVVMPVVDGNDVLRGIITIDDIVDVVIEEATEDLYKLSGTTEVEEEKLLQGNIMYPLASRLPWLIVTGLGGFVASAIIAMYSGMYSSDLFTLAVSLSFVPLLMGLGGTVGSQSSTIIVRGLSTGVVREQYAAGYVVRELVVGLLMGVIVGILFAAASLFFGNDRVITGIVTATLIINITIASLFGAIMPIIFKRFNIDPAVASAPFVCTTLDIVGQLVYFSITLGLIGLLAS